ncbi:HNH endonuclease [Mycobacteroides salmoniphilum]|nr:HNH endonuclease [Mycobacteroides salmoniphilum]
MRKLYEQRLARPRTPAYPIYEQLRNSGAGRRCAYCRAGTARTLDHFIPKHHIGTLAIEPWNLVPCCDSCNNHLGHRWDRSPSGRAIHPYFMPDLGRWLRASVDVSHDPTEPAIVVYRPDPDPSLGEELCSRVRAQFEALSLRGTIGTFAVDELQTVQRRLQTRFWDEHDAREYLAEEAEVLLEYDSNSIRGVLYEALSVSTAFICANLCPA